MLIVKTSAQGEMVQMHVHVDAQAMDEALAGGIIELLVRMGIPVSTEADVMESLVQMLGEERAIDVLQAAAMNYFIPQALTQCEIAPLVSPMPHTDQKPEAHADFDFDVDVYPKGESELTSYERASAHVHKLPEPTDEDIEGQLQMLINVSNATRGENDAEATLTDEWVAEVYAEDGIKSVDELRKAMREAAEQYARDAFEQEQQNAMLHEWAKRLKATPSDAVVDALAHEMISAATMTLAQQGATLQQYVESLQTTEEDFRAQMKVEARETLSTSLAMDAIFAHMDVVVADEVLERVAAMANPDQDPQKTLADAKATGRYYALLENAQRTMAVVWAYDNTDFEIVEAHDHCGCHDEGCCCGC